jgi:TRAP-type uncharacterized transport system substrate-binding protein
MIRRANSYGSVPNIKRHSRKELDKAMSQSTWEYNNVMSSSYMYQSK